MQCFATPRSVAGAVCCSPSAHRSIESWGAVLQGLPRLLRPPKQRPLHRPLLSVPRRLLRRRRLPLLLRLSLRRLLRRRRLQRPLRRRLLLRRRRYRRLRRPLRRLHPLQRPRQHQWPNRRRRLRHRRRHRRRPQHLPSEECGSLLSVCAAHLGTRRVLDTRPACKLFLGPCVRSFVSFAQGPLLACLSLCIGIMPSVPFKRVVSDSRANVGGPCGVPRLHVCIGSRRIALIPTQQRVAAPNKPS